MPSESIADHTNTQHLFTCPCILYETYRQAIQPEGQCTTDLAFEFLIYLTGTLVQFLVDNTTLILKIIIELVSGRNRRQLPPTYYSPPSSL